MICEDFRSQAQTARGFVSAARPRSLRRVPGRSFGVRVLLLSSLLSICSFGGGLAQAAIYYVNISSGNDANSGTSTGAAWKSVARVNAQPLQPGDQVLFARGQTWREQLTPTSSGASGNPIVFGAYGAGANPLLKRSDLFSNWWEQTLVANGGFEDYIEGEPRDIFDRGFQWSYDSARVQADRNIMGAGLASVRLEAKGTGSLSTNAGSVYVYQSIVAKNSTPYTVRYLGRTSTSAPYNLILRIQDSSSGRYWNPATGSWGGTTPITASSMAGEPTSQWIEKTVGFTSLSSGTTEIKLEFLNFENANSWADNLRAYEGSGVTGTSGVWAGRIESDFPKARGAIVNGVRIEEKVVDDEAEALTITEENVFFRRETQSGYFWMARAAGPPPQIEIGSRGHSVLVRDVSHIRVENLDGYGPDSAVTLVEMGGAIIQVDGVSRDVTIANCEVTLSLGFGIFADETTQDIIFDGIDSHANGSTGIYMNSLGGAVINSSSHDNGLLPFDTGDRGGIGSFRGGNLLFAGNNISGNALIDTDADFEISIVDPRGPYQILRNFIHNVRQGAVQLYGDAGGSLIAYNIFDGFGETSITDSTTTGKFGGLRLDIHNASSSNGIQVYNNTFTRGAKSAFNGHAALIVSSGGLSHLKIKNNLFSGNNSRDIMIDYDASLTGLEIDNNLYYKSGPSNCWHWLGVYMGSLSQWSSASGHGYNSMFADPRFIDPGGNLSLAADSPAINAGVDVGLTTDFLGQPVPNGGAFDIGAIEFSSETIASTGGPIGFGSWHVDAGAAPAQHFTLHNTGGFTMNFTGAGLNLTGADASQFHFSSNPPDESPLAPGSTRQYGIAFDPTSAGAKNASVTITTDAGDTSVALSGTGTDAQLTVEPSTLSHGSQDPSAGATPPLYFAIQNFGSGTLSFTGLGMSLGGADASQFHFASNPPDTSPLAAGQGRYYGVTFNPTSEGSKSASVVITTDGGDFNVGLFGDGTASQPQLSASPNNRAFGSHEVGSGPTSALFFTIQNLGNGTLSFTGSGIGLGGADASQFHFSPNPPSTASLGPGESRQYGVTFDPTAEGAKSASIVITTDGGGSSIPLTGQGTTAAQPVLQVTPSNRAFGEQDIDSGATSALFYTIYNIGDGTLSFTGAGIDLGGADASQFHFSQNPPDEAPISPGQSRQYGVTFNPTTDGTKSASIVITTDGGSFNIALSGQGTSSQPQLQASPSSLNFGSRDTDDGASSPLLFTVQNVGDGTLSFTGLGLSLGGMDASQFHYSSNPPDETPLSPGQSRQYGVVFDPTTEGTKTAIAYIATDGGSFNLALLGNGTDPQPQLQASPPALGFGTQEIGAGASSSLLLTIQNVGDAALSFTGLGLSLEGTDASQFHLSQNPPDFSPLAPGQSRQYGVTFFPTTAGQKTATAVVSTDGGDFNVALAGEGTLAPPELQVTPASIDLGLQRVGDGPTGASSFTVQNIGQSPLSFTGLGIVLGGVNANEFHLTQNPPDESPLSAGQSRQFSVTFYPSSEGSKSASVNITSDGGAFNVALSGVGTIPRLKLWPWRKTPRDWPPSLTVPLTSVPRKLPCTTTLFTELRGASR